MPSTRLRGSFPLTETGIDNEVTKTSPGAYVLGYLSSSRTFIVRYVGRADEDIKERLKKWIGKKNYKRFKYGYFFSPKAAFEKECRLYHDFGGKAKLDNDIHPARPENTNWECPVCTIFD
ncbi:hypothetical protein ES703_121261 [subsurface metagenome]